MNNKKAILPKICIECAELEKEFSDSCRYRTCHYRHNQLSEALKLAGRMAGELNGTVDADMLEEYKSIVAIVSNFAESLRGNVGDARLYGVLREAEELAFRLVRSMEDASDKY